MDNVKTSRAGRKRKLSEDDGATTPVTKKKVGGTGRPRGRPPGKGKGAGQSALGDVRFTPSHVSQAVGPQGGAAHGVRTRSRAAGDSTSKHSSRIVDDDPDEDNDALSSDGMSGSDYEEETRLRGVDEDVSDDTSESADDTAE
ncbi:hypothetical protein CBR_g57055 [Chara braunii]|uniref:Uncharacterized protein n=1 Tax=Chara braunii TaxID=69332 RepID=A0A388K8B6_CHABU|nr:hypothetical protein CBR_g57055 [Chara braunii]|eukprot:GBG66173.1 hypothetical protein CBR_g57055 [Chara braunii]